MWCFQKVGLALHLLRTVSEVLQCLGDLWDLQAAQRQRIIHYVGERKIAIFKNANISGMSKRRIELLCEAVLSVINNVSLL